MIPPNTPDGWTSIRSSFYNELLAENRELREALTGLMKYRADNAYPHTAADWERAENALGLGKAQ